ncbi:MAG TPA: DUF6323 family protein [Bacillota bacterium]|nr:DUF6323 family protein [Bacillota bacterium]
MAYDLELLSFRSLDAKSEASVAECNEETVNYGLVLSKNDIHDLIETRDNALIATGRVEFGGGIIERIIYKFCDSPYIWQSNYAQTINDLTEIFYFFKNETLDSLTDEELLTVMKEAFDAPCAGSTELLASREMIWFSRNRRYGLYHTDAFDSEGGFGHHFGNEPDEGEDEREEYYDE